MRPGNLRAVIERTKRSRTLGAAACRHAVAASAHLAAFLRAESRRPAEACSSGPANRSTAVGATPASPEESTGVGATPASPEARARGPPGATRPHPGTDLIDAEELKPEINTKRSLYGTQNTERNDRT
jgi:hypothetical protein